MASAVASQALYRSEHWGAVGFMFKQLYKIEDAYSLAAFYYI